MFYHPETQRKFAPNSAFELNGDQYPPNWFNLSTAQDKIDKGFVDLIVDQQPSFDPVSQICIAGPVAKIGEEWHDTWEILALPEEVIANNKASALQKMEADIDAAMMNLFNETAIARRYKSMETCVMRAGFTGPFQAEGIAFASWMDAQNTKAYMMLSEVRAGTMPMPATVAEAIALLDPMVWPT